jgi:hypothetical protein
MGSAQLALGGQIHAAFPKEEKLREYKNIEDNKSISEYWLAIIISDPIQIDIKNYQLHDTLISGYNRIFLIKGIHCVQIK